MDWDDDFPYLAEATALPPPAAPEARAWPCPVAPEGEEARLLRPRSRAELMRCAAALRGRARCLLLAPPRETGGWLPVGSGDLAAWAGAAEARLGRPVRLLAGRGACPCGETPACRAHAGVAEAEGKAALECLALRAESLGAALNAAFPKTPPRARRILQEWAHLGDPRRPGQPISAEALGARHGLSGRQIRRLLAAARAENPALCAKLRALRTHRARKVGAWEVRGV